MKNIFKRKVKIQIKSIWGDILFEHKAENNTIKKTLEEANLQGADLRGADLWRADLQRANLWRANLQGADLRGADLWRADLRGVDLQRADLRGAKNIELYWHIHHDQLIENLTEPIKNRIDFIKKEKPKDEIKLRLKLLKKVKCKPENYPITPEGWKKLHKKECPKCPWRDGTIFPKGRSLTK